MLSAEQLPPFTLRVERRVLHFRTPARTSGGALRERTVFYVHAETAHGTGTGECCTMPHLSPEAGADYETRLQAACAAVQRNRALPPEQAAFPASFRFGIECALLAACRPQHPMWHTPVARGEAGICLHHLIWMDTAEKMLAQMENGIRRGFTCLKMKIGALPFEEEISLLQEARRRYPQAELRVDANGAFRSVAEAAEKMHRLADCGAAWIEQPLPWGQTARTAELAALNILPLALDEELMAAATHADRERLLDAVRPQGIVIKPSLHGGLSGAEDWAALAASRGIRWWVNSALESHVGLRHLLLWCGLQAPHRLHGLGTGLLYTDDSPATELRCHKLFAL